MSRVLMIGMGVPSFLAARRHAGPGLRAAHLAAALAGEGHRVLLVCVCRDGEEAGVHAAPPPGLEGIEIVFTDESRLSAQAMRRRLETFAPEAVVGVTAYAAALALRLRLGVPTWADIFGDLLAEAQAKAAGSGGDWSLVHFWSLLTPVLESADRFSAVSSAHSHALVGQLGLTGRLSSATAGEALVEVIPCAAQAVLDAKDRERLRAQARARLGIDAAALVALVSGGFNTWCDVETLGQGIALALNREPARELDREPARELAARELTREPRLHVVITGGAIAGHDERSYARFLEHLGSAGRDERVHILGWTDSGDLASLYAAADVGLNIERDLYERRLGAENRVTEWLANGLPALTTARSESGAELVRRGLALACEPGSPSALADTLASLAAGHARLAEIGACAREFAREHRSLAATARPLLQWAAAPCFARDHASQRLLRLGLLSHPQGSTEMLEAYVNELSTAQLLRRGLRWTLRRAFGLLGCAAVTMLAACEPPPDGRPPLPDRPPNILLVSIDTLRADHLGVYGYPNPTSPVIDALAARGTVFEHAIASAPETAPAMATLLTGLYQDRHKVAFNRTNLPPETTTLAEVLAKAGYATAAFVANRIIDAKHGFGQGFERFEVAGIEPPATVATDDRVASLAISWLQAASRDKPWFAWVHMLDPHGPYNSAPEWWSESFQYSPRMFGEDPEYTVSDSNFGLDIIPRYQSLAEMTRLSQYVRRYDGEIRFSDHQLGALLGAVALAGHQDTLVILVADHGESLTEHGELLQHGWYLYDQTVRVPLVLSWPGRIPAGARIATQTCTVDIVPTVLDLAGIDPGELETDGASLAGELRGADPAPGASTRDCFSIGPRHNRLFALRSGGLKLIVTREGVPSDPRVIDREDPAFVPAAPRTELYDLVADPAETINVIDRRREDAADMSQRLDVMRARFRSRGLRW